METLAFDSIYTAILAFIAFLCVLNLVGWNLKLIPTRSQTLENHGKR